MDEYGFTIRKINSHYVLYQYGIFKCSGDNEREIEETITEILGK